LFRLITVRMGETDLAGFDIMIPVYHVDTESQNDKFVHGGFFPSQEDGVWAGKGMYFWDNFSNAKYWLQIQHSHLPDKNFNTSKSKLICSEKDILDMTRTDTSQEVKVFAIRFSGEFDVDLDMDKNGEVINFLHDVLEKRQAKHIFSVVKEHGLYPKTKIKGLIGSNEIGYHGDRKKVIPLPTSKVKTVYAVRDRSLLQRREIADPTKEVISDEFSF